jgi:predicted methyltransferase
MCLKASKDCDIKKKLLVLLIAVIPAWMPNLATAIAIDVGDVMTIISDVGDADCDLIPSSRRCLGVD